MDDILVVVRLALAAVFLVAAASKLADRAGTRRAARALGVPDRIAGLVRIALPCVEIVVAAALWPVSTAAWAGAAAMTLMAVFTALIAANLARGRRPSCHCFGALDDEPISGWTLVRNVVLLAAAAFVATSGRKSGADMFAGDPLVDVVAFAGLAALAVGVARSTHAEVTPGTADRPESAFDVGDVAPDFVLPDADGRGVSLASLRARGLPVVLVFGKLGCPSCLALLPDIESWQRELADTCTIAFVVSASADDAHTMTKHHAIEHLLVQEGREVTDLFGLHFAPSTLAVSSAGRISSALVAGPDAIRLLVDDIAGRPVTPHETSQETLALLAGASVLGVGSAAPDFRLHSAAGQLTSPRDLPIGTLAFVFVQRSCSQCNDLLDQLSLRPDLRSRAVVVSSGSTPAVVPDRLTSPVLLDRRGFLPAAYGVTAMPSAVLVEDQIVRSSVAIGTDAILGLLSGVIVPEPIDAEDITEDFVPRPHPRVVTLALDGVSIVGDPVTGRFNRLDAPGRLLWSCFDGTESLRQVAAGISAELGAPPDVVRTDVLAFARQMGGAGALDGVRPSQV